MHRESAFRPLAVAAMAIMGLLAHPPAHAQAAPKPVEADGTVNVPAFRLPPSVYLSPEAKKTLPRTARDDSAMLDRAVESGGIQRFRENMPRFMAPSIRREAELYPTKVERTEIAGVKAVRITPAAGVARKDRRKILLNLPGGGFLIGNAEGGGMLESAPLAALTGIEVISITYRQAPEATFPAASEDVARVYRELLRTHRPRDIGIFGCSAGGILTAQALAWFDKEGLPMPGAAGILCASADARWAGDSWYWQRALHGLDVAPSLDERFYYGGHDLADPLMSPIESDMLLGRFPPTLLITATRAGELSSAVDTHRRLVRAGVDAELHVWDGLDHAFFYNPGIPETREAFDVMARFFRRHLGRKP